MANCIFLPKECLGGNKTDFKWQRPGVIIGGFWRKFATVCYRGNATNVYLNDLRASGKNSDLLGCEVTVHLHFHGKKFPVRYLADRKNVSFLDENTK